MTERVEFDDIETALVTYLRQELQALGDTAKVGTRRLPTTPERYVRVSRVGGTRATLVTDAPLVVVENWDATDPEAARLGMRTRSIMQAMRSVFVGPACVSWRSEVGGLAWNPHPDTALPRYQHTQQMTVDGRTVGAS